MARAISSRRSRGTFSSPPSQSPRHHRLNRVGLERAVRLDEGSRVVAACVGHDGKYVGATSQRRGMIVGARRWAWGMSGAFILACAVPKVPLGDPKREIAALLSRSAGDWNRG